MIKTIQIFVEKYMAFAEFTSYTLVGVAAIIISILQLQTSRLELRLQKIQLEPLIRVETTLIDQENSTELLSISNEGATIKDFTYEVTTFYRAEHTNKKKFDKKEIWIPINDYYVGSHVSRNYKGVLLEKFTPNNNSEFHRLYLSAIEDSKNDDYYLFIDKINLIKLSFTDSTGKKYIQYYKNNIEIQENDFEKLTRLISENTTEKNYNIANLYLSEIKEMLSIN